MPHRLWQLPQSGELADADRRPRQSAVGGVLAGKHEGSYAYYGSPFQLPGYVRLDAFAAYKWNVHKFPVTAQFNIRNLLDKTYYESTAPDSNVSPRTGIYPGAPRSVELPTATLAGSARISIGRKRGKVVIESSSRTSTLVSETS